MSLCVLLHISFRFVFVSLKNLNVTAIRTMLYCDILCGITIYTVHYDTQNAFNFVPFLIIRLEHTSELLLL